VFSSNFSNISAIVHSEKQNVIYIQIITQELYGHAKKEKSIKLLRTIYDIFKEGR